MDNYRTQQSEVQKIISKTNKNMAKNKYTAEDATVIIFDEIWEEAAGLVRLTSWHALCLSLYVCMHVYMC